MKTSKTHRAGACTCQRCVAIARARRRDLARMQLLLHSVQAHRAMAVGYRQQGAATFAMTEDRCADQFELEAQRIATRWQVRP